MSLVCGHNAVSNHLNPVKHRYCLKFATMQTLVKILLVADPRKRYTTKHLFDRVMPKIPTILSGYKPFAVVLVVVVRVAKVASGASRAYGLWLLGGRSRLRWRWSLPEPCGRPTTSHSGFKRQPRPVSPVRGS